jgi:cytoskeletal protein CcmA (bactofilin family)
MNRPIPPHAWVPHGSSARLGGHADANAQSAGDRPRGNDPHRQSIVIKGELSCGEDLYIDGGVEGVIDPKGNRLTIGPNGRVRANVTACAVVVQGKLEGSIQPTEST